jgi:hypothetical protein
MIDVQQKRLTTYRRQKFPSYRRHGSSSQSGSTPRLVFSLERPPEVEAFTIIHHHRRPTNVLSFKRTPWTSLVAVGSPLYSVSPVVSPKLALAPLSASVGAPFRLVEYSVAPVASPKFGSVCCSWKMQRQVEGGATSSDLISFTSQQLQSNLQLSAQDETQLQGSV